MLIALSIAFSAFVVPALADVAPSDISAAEALAGEAAARLRSAEGDLAAGERRFDRLEGSLSSVAERLERQDEEIVEGRAGKYTGRRQAGHRRRGRLRGNRRSRNGHVFKGSKRIRSQPIRSIAVNAAESPSK